MHNALYALSINQAIKLHLYKSRTVPRNLVIGEGVHYIEYALLFRKPQLALP
jgi:hypothetical protein